MLVRSPLSIGVRQATLPRGRIGCVVAHVTNAPLVLLSEEDAPVGAVLTDTLLDIGVYTLLLGVAALTIYSLYVTLQQSNKEYGGWSPRDDQPVTPVEPRVNERLRPGAVYDPATEQWTYPATSDVEAPRVGRAKAAAPSTGADGTNRYDRRAAKKRKKSGARKNR